jgi:hypothetical protein
MFKYNNMEFNYQQICENLLKDLPDRQREVISRRFALKGEGGVKRETLEAIGKDFGITRERVRQIEEDGLSKIKPKIKEYQKIFQHFKKLLKETGDLKREDIFLKNLAGENYQNQVFFLLTLAKDFQRFSETKERYPFWTINLRSVDLAQKVIDCLSEKLKEINRPLTFQELKSLVNFSLSPRVLESFLEISKVIQKNADGFFGLKDWPEINPRGIKDKAYLVFKKEKRPLHFTEVANLIPEKALPQTVHNELIKDPRFVLVGRGTYALAEWGYFPGEVKEVIFRILKEEGPLTKEEILKKVLSQRVVKVNTVLLNLANKKYFLRDSQGRYQIKEI